MSDPLRIIHGPFGRVVLVRLDHSMVLHAHRDCHIVFKIGGADIQFGINGKEYPVTAQSVLMINAWEPHFYNHRETNEKTVLLAFYLLPQWLKELDRRFAHSAQPRFFARPVENLTLRLARTRDDVVDALTQHVPPSIIDRCCFRKNHKRLGLRIDSVVVIEGGNPQKRMHAHLALTCPPAISSQQFRSYVQKAVSRCKSLGEQYEVSPIFDSAGWARYLAKEGIEALSPQCTHVAKR